MKIYITAPFQGSDNKLEIEYLCGLVRQAGLEDFCFIRDIENYQKIFDDSNKLMKRVLEEIEKCDAFLLDYDGGANGRMIALGIAYSLGKKIILIHHTSIIIKDIVQGTANYIIPYDNLEDIVIPLSQMTK